VIGAPESRLLPSYRLDGSNCWVYNRVVSRLIVLPSPSPAVVLNRYEGAVFKEFGQLFEPPLSSSPLRHLARDPQEASFVVVLENRSEKAITGLRYRWEMTWESGNRRSHTTSGDSYAVDVYRAVAEPGSRHLISPSGSVDETLLKHVLAGGGFIAGASASKHSWADVVEVTFEIHLVLFADGEIAGPDPDGYTEELQCRKPAVEFIARQIRLARAEGRDITPVLAALAEAPAFGGLGHAQGDPLVHWVRHYAQDYLRNMHRKIGRLDMGEAKLQYLENRPTLPQFYRRHLPSE
jgi:hypothetical protein